MTPADAVQILMDESLEIHWDECWEVLKTIRDTDPEQIASLLDALSCESDSAVIFALIGLRKMNYNFEKVSDQLEVLIKYSRDPEITQEILNIIAENPSAPCSKGSQEQ